MNRFLKLLVTITFCAFLLPLKALAEDIPIGKIILAQGNPIIEREGKQLSAKRNDDLFEKDILTTPLKSRLLIKLKDQSTISLAENTHFELSRYSFDETKSQVSFKMLKGAFRALTGMIGKQDDPIFEVHTPIATIGVRGTDFWGGFIFSDALDVTMISGKGVYVTNTYGSVEISEAGLGTTVNADSPPSALKQWPQEKVDKAISATQVDKNN